MSSIALRLFVPLFLPSALCPLFSAICSPLAQLCLPDRQFRISILLSHLCESGPVARLISEFHHVLSQFRISLRVFISQASYFSSPECPFFSISRSRTSCLSIYERQGAGAKVTVIIVGNSICRENGWNASVRGGPIRIDYLLTWARPSVAGNIESGSHI